MAPDKTLLIYVQDYSEGFSPEERFGEDLNIPLGILYLGSHLNSNGHRVKLLDTRLGAGEDFFKELKNELNGCLLAGLSVMTPCVRKALAISRFIKDINPSVKIVWGGIHPTLFPEATVLGSDIDFVIVKEGEKALLGLVRYLSGAAADVSEIPNLVRKEGARPLKNGVDAEPGPASIGFPKYELLQTARYVDRLVAPLRRRRQAEVITSRGCPYRCAFCVNTIAYNSRWIQEPLRQTLKNLDLLISVYKVEHVFFMDEDFFCNRKRMKELVGQIAARNITWESNCRADYVSPGYLDDDFLDLLRRSGCRRLRLGMESGSQRILDMLKKDITVEQSLNAARKLTEHAIMPSASFMIGLPEETRDDVVKTADLIFKLYEINPGVHLIGPLIFRPYPGSELFRKCQELGLNSPAVLDEWSDFYIHNTLEEYKSGLPWFPYVYMFKRMGLFMAYLRVRTENRITRFFVRAIVRFHILTKLRFIEADYVAYKFFRSLGLPALKRSRNSSKEGV